jgi:hypothetical protein
MLEAEHQDAERAAAAAFARARVEQHRDELHIRLGHRRGGGLLGLIFDILK